MKTTPATSQIVSTPDPVARIPFLDSGGPGTPLVFLHANGFPPACYQPLLALLSARYRTLPMMERPLWPAARPAELSDWQVLSSDVLRFFDELGLDRAMVVGHSMGAIAALRAALWAPQRFVALILLEPVLLPRSVMLEWRIVRALRLGNRLHPLIPGALRRQRQFPGLETAFERYRQRPIFRYFSDEELRAYIAGMTTPSADGGYRLVYSPEWEARIYDTGIWNDWDLWKGISALTVPTLIVRGAESDTLRGSVTREIARQNAQVRIVVVQRSTHLLPLERPKDVFDLIVGFLSEVRLGPNPQRMS